MIAQTLIQITVIAILIRRVWSCKQLDRQRKQNWTGLLIVFGNVAVLFYVWGQDKIFLKDNSVSLPDPLPETDDEA
jgi:hypothetical protein